MQSPGTLIPRAAAGRVVQVHPALVRITHWLNVAAIFVMVGSGWRIYDNVPILSWLSFPEWATIGGDPDLTYKLNGDVGFGNALLWHFAAMWLLVANGAVYVSYGILSGRFRRKLLPISPRELVADVGNALRFKLAHADISLYNSVQKLLYVGVIALLMLIVASGLAVWKPVQLQTLAALLGGFQGARTVHFACMCAIVAFIAVHVSLSVLVPATLAAMITGRATLPVEPGAPGAPGAPGG